MRNTTTIRRSAAGAALALAALALGVTSPTPGAGQSLRPQATEPVRDGSGADIGLFDTWVTNVHRDVSATEPLGWTAMHNGIFGHSPVQQVAGRTGSAVQGTITKVATDQGDVVLRADISAGPYVEDPDGLNNGGGIPVSRRYRAITGYYQFLPRKGDQLSILINMYRDGTPIGQGGATTRKKAPGWKKFKAPIFYFGSGAPDTAFVLLQIVGPKARRGFKPVHPGSVFRADDLAWVP